MEQDAIIPTPQAQQATALNCRIEEENFQMRFVRPTYFRRYCYEEDFHEAAPRQCDGGVR